MSVFKKIAAGLTAVTMIAACTGCSNTTTAMNAGDYVVPAGVYLYYLNSAYNNALSQLAEQNPDMDTTDVKAVKASVLEGKDVRTWCEDKAEELCSGFIATELKFAELGLELNEETQTSIDSMLAYYQASYTDMMNAMTEDGISEESFRKILTSSYKSEEIFNYYYAVGSQEGVTEDELKDYYLENNIRAQYVAFDLHDSEGNLLESDQQTEIKKLAEDYLKRAESAYRTGGAEAVMKEMDTIQEDYTAYQESVAAEEAETETASEPVPSVQNKPRMLTAEEVQDTTETEEMSAETTEATDETPAEESVAETETETSAEEEFAYQNERIISIINKDDYENEEDIRYTPDETVYNELLGISEADYGKVHLVEEEEIYYLVVRYDIAERMTEEDLWTESTITNVQYAKYNDAFEAKMDEWTAALTITRNEASFKRYDPYKYHFG